MAKRARGNSRISRLTPGVRTLLAVFCLAAIGGAGVRAGKLASERFQARRGEDPTRAQAVAGALENVFLDTGVDRTEYHARPGAAEGGDGTAEIRVGLPGSTTLARMNADITQAVEGVGAQIHDARETGSPGSPEDLRILLSVGEEVTHAVTLSAETPRADPDPADDNPRMAIVFDDLGYTTTGLPAELLDLGIPLTFAILPGLPHSDEFAEMARERGHEVLLHLPMEPVDAVRHNPGEEAILAGLGAEENLRRLRVQLGSFSGYRGVSNHMGSRATADPELMDVLFGEIRRKDRGLFFLDSRTTPYSVAVASGRRTGLSVINNNLFLDGTDEGEPGPRVLTGRLAAIAQRTGRAVGIGHVRRETVNAVREAIPKWREERVELVLLSELGQDPSRGRKRQSPPRTR